ncbi:MAG: GspE/PulE family protein [Bacteroidota bacterium]
MTPSTLTLSGSIIKQVDTIIQEAIDRSASDIHIEPYEHRFRVRFRLDGVLREMVELPLSQKEAVISRLKIMSNLDIAEKRKPQDGRIKIRQKDTSDIDLRVSTLPTQYGEKMVLRVLDKGKLKLNLENLGFEKDELELFRKAIRSPYGMILVTGPTGSGKTTTLYSALSELNASTDNITTIEDPIEYNLDGINQTQVHEDIDLTFANVLRSILRQDPNTVMVGEIRDKETADIAIRAALTGHLVFSTLHTNDAASAITRLIDMGIEPFLVASSLRLVVAQRLVRKICTDCKTEVDIPAEHLTRLKLTNGSKSYVGKGCETCSGYGYKGRVALIEVLELREEISELIMNQANAGEIKQKSMSLGYRTLFESGKKKILSGVTTIEEVLKEVV